MPPARSRHCVENHGERRFYGADRWCAECRAEQNTRVRLEKRQFIDAHKLALGCFRCGYARVPSALHMHHTAPSVKEMTVAEAASRGWVHIRRELAACVVVCANCHAELHAEKRAAAVPSDTSGTVAP